MERKGEGSIAAKQTPASKSALVAFVVSLLLAITVVTICVETIYIRQLQEREQQRLEMIRRLQEKHGERLHSLEKILSSCSCSRDDILRKTSKDVHRNKRRLNIMEHHDTEGDGEESPHIRGSHHGIPSSNIALVYADPTIFNRTEYNESDLYRMVKTHRRTPTHCGRVLGNGRRDRLCTPKIGTNDYTSFLMGTGVDDYPYFAKAPWMNRNQNFQLNGTQLVVQRPGLYLVTTNMVFVDNGIVDYPHYGVYTSDASELNERLISYCSAPISEYDYLRIKPCQTLQLISLNAGDRVYMKIGGYVWFRIDKESFSMALIKLNDMVM